MKIMHVSVKVKPEMVEAFKAATVENARNTVQEPGNLRFDVLQDSEDPTHFMLIEIYKDDDARNAHFASDHFAAWRAATTDHTAESNSVTSFDGVFLDAK